MKSSLQFETNKKLWDGSQSLIQRLRDLGLKLASAESCTGGLFSALITEHAGVSDVYLGGFIAYDNRIKETALKVPHDILDQYGAVSPEVAILMARGAQMALEADLAVSVTGIAGPSGGSEQKPVGLVCFGLSANVKGQLGEYQKTMIFQNNGRQSIRIESVTTMIDMANEFVNNLH